jgi:autophagy-related protein 11
MSLTIYVAHSGNKILAEPTKINSLDALRAWVQRTAHIPVNKQVFLTSKGKGLRPQALLTESEIYVFDSGSFSSTNTNLSLIPDPSPLSPDTPPDSIANHDQLPSWNTIKSKPSSSKASASPS